MLLHENLGGEAGTVVLTGGADDTVEEDGVDGETPLRWKRVLQNWIPSCARGPRTLGSTWPIMRSTERELNGGRQKSATGSGVGVRRVKLEQQNLVEKHCDPLVKLRAEGIKERVARAPTNRQ
jgi:hypothetical protein